MFAAVNISLIGHAFAANLPWLARAGAMWLWYQWIGFAMSEISYMLYLVHFPLLAWRYFTVFAPAQMEPNAFSLGILALALIVVIGYSAALWWLFERNTDRFRGALTAWWLHRMKSPRQA